MCAARLRVLCVSGLPAGVTLWRSPVTGTVYVDKDHYEALTQLLQARPEGQ